MAQCLTANERVELSKIERPTCSSTVFMSVRVATSSLSEPRTNHVLAEARGLEAEFVAELPESASVIQERAQADERLAHWDCDAVTAEVIVDTSSLSDEETAEVAGLAAEYEHDLVTVVGEALEKAQSE
jgi:hypothetical protein